MGSHDGERKARKVPKKKLDAEFGVVRGIDFKNVHTVIFKPLQKHFYQMRTLGESTVLFKLLINDLSY